MSVRYYYYTDQRKTQGQNMTEDTNAEEKLKFAGWGEGRSHWLSLADVLCGCFFVNAADDSAVFWGIKYFNDMLMAAGPSGNVQSELLFQKTKAFKFNNGWALPHRVYFNGDDCVLPDLQDYPSLPNSGSSCHLSVHMFRLILSIISTGASVLIFSS